MGDPLSAIGEDVTQLAGELIRIPSENPPGEEEEVAEFFAEYLRRLGLSVEIYELLPRRLNVVARLRGSEGKPVLMLNGHLDVVPAGERSAWSFDPFCGRVDGGRVLGRGSSDMKGGLAAMLVAAKTLVEKAPPLKGDLMIAGVMDEESSGLGTSNLLGRGYRADMAVIGEPTGLNVLRAHKGALWLEIAVRGLAGHASKIRSRGEGGPINAVFKAAKLVEALEKHLTFLEQRRNPLLGSSTISVGRIEAGVKVNMVPERCIIEVDRRLLPGESPEVAKEEVEEILRRLADSDPDFKASVKVLSQREGAEVPDSEKVVRVCQEAVRAVTGREARVAGFPATSDMAILVNRGHIPTVLLGPGSLDQAHGVDEYVEASQLVDAAKIYTKIALLTLSG